MRRHRYTTTSIETTISMRTLRKRCTTTIATNTKSTTTTFTAKTKTIRRTTVVQWLAMAWWAHRTIRTAIAHNRRTCTTRAPPVTSSIQTIKWSRKWYSNRICICTTSRRCRTWAPNPNCRTCQGIVWQMPCAVRRHVKPTTASNRRACIAEANRCTAFIPCWKMTIR